MSDESLHRIIDEHVDIERGLHTAFVRLADHARDVAENPIARVLALKFALLDDPIAPIEGQVLKSMLEPFDFVNSPGFAPRMILKSVYRSLTFVLRDDSLTLGSVMVKMKSRIERDVDDKETMTHALETVCEGFPKFVGGYMAMAVANNLIYRVFGGAIEGIDKAFVSL